jgi:hypothetical protein
VEVVCKGHLLVGPGGGWLTNFYVGSDHNFVDTCLHEKGKVKAVKKVSGGRTHWPSGHVAWPPGHHLVSYHLGQVGGAPPQPDKYPPIDGNQSTHHILEIPLAKLSFLV